MNDQETVPSAVQPPAFDWFIYADATLAGLAVLLPLPLVDMAFEGYFRRRMPHSIARRHEQTLASTVLHRLQEQPAHFSTFWRGCLLWPVKLLGEFLLRLSRKVLYFLTIKKAVDALTYYWQRAFLLNYMVQQGYLVEETASLAVTALEKTLAETSSSPLHSLAREILYSPLRIWRSLWRARAQQRAKQNDPRLAQIRAHLSQRWSSFDPFFAHLIQHYEQTYRHELKTAMRIR